MEKQVSVGKVSDSMEKLTNHCKEKAALLAKSMSNNTEEIVTFWTGDIPELICVGKFSKSTDGKIVYNLDFSQSTL